MKRWMIQFSKVSERNRALNIRLEDRTPLRWDRYEREWYIEEEASLPLYEEFVHNRNTAAVKRLSDVGRQKKNIREYTDKIFNDPEIGKTFFRVMFRFRNLNLDNIILISALNPEAHVFKGFEEWKKAGLEIKRSGISFLDFYPIDSTCVQAETLTGGIAAKLERKDCQRLAVYMIRKNKEEGRCYDILQMSYEQQTERTIVLHEKQSRKELKQFITAYVLDQEIDLEKDTLLPVYPDTSLDMESSDRKAVNRILAEETKSKAAFDLHKLYSALCQLCREIRTPCLPEVETVEAAIKQRLQVIVWEWTDSQQKDIVLLLLYLFYGIGQEYPNLGNVVSEGMTKAEHDRLRRECLKDIKRTFDQVVYNIDLYMDREIKSVFSFRMSEEDVRGEHVETEDDQKDDTEATEILNFLDMEYEGIRDNEEDYTSLDFMEGELESEEDISEDYEITETDMAEAADIYNLVFEGDSAEEKSDGLENVCQGNNLNDDRNPSADKIDDISETYAYEPETIRIERISEMPSDAHKFTGIWIRRDDGDLPVKIEYHKGQLVICKCDEVVPFSVMEYNKLADCGYEKIVETKNVENWTGNVPEEDMSSEKPVTPAQREWIEENKLEELHCVTLCFWQLREIYQQFRVSYKIFQEIYKEKVKRERYEKKIEITLKSCESLSELKDTFYYQILTESKEQPLLQDYFVNGGPDTARIGDLMEVYSLQDDMYDLYYVDTRGFVKISREEFYECGKDQRPESVFWKQYQKDRILALTVHLKVDEQIARVINVLPQSILRVPKREADIFKYRRRGVNMAEKIKTMLPSTPVLICSSCITMPGEDERRIKEKEPQLYEKLYSIDYALKKGKIIPFRVFCEAVDVYQDMVWEKKERGVFEGADIMDFLIFGQVEHTQEIYVYFSSIKIGDKHQCMYDRLTEDMNRQYGRLYEEYRQGGKRSKGYLTSEERFAAKKEMGCYERMVEIINKVVNVKE